MSRHGVGDDEGCSNASEIAPPKEVGGFQEDQAF